VAGGWWPETRTGDLVNYLGEDELRRLLACTESASVAPGEPILRKGSPSRSLLIVEEGEVEIVEESSGEVLACVGPGGVVGEVGFVDGQARTNDVRARNACKLRRLTRERLLELVKGDAPLFAKLTIALAELLAKRFRAAVAELEPVRAFASRLRDPAAAEAGEGSDFDEIDEPLPEEARELIRRVAGKAGDDVAGV
jgi:CRP-like cAMP-binding protein